MPSMTSDGCEDASVAKKKSEPRLLQAVPSFKFLASKLAVMASRRPALLDLARSINCGAVNFSEANADTRRQIDTRANFRIERLLYARAGTFYYEHPGPRTWRESGKCCKKLERETGIEPATSSLGSWRSTAELLPLTYRINRKFSTQVPRRTI